jgi:hypothetical protein
MAGELVARVPTTGRPLNVVRFSVHIGLHDDPNPAAHGGYTFDFARARELADAITSGHPARIATGEGAVLIFEPQYPRLRPDHQDNGWTFEDGARDLGAALLRATGAEPNAALVR